MGRRRSLGRESSLALKWRGQGTAKGRLPFGDPGMPVAAHQAPVRFGGGALS